MDNLVSVNVRIEKDQMITDSRNVSDVFNKQHRHVLESIRNLEKDVPNFRQMFFEATMPDSYGREQIVYFMNRDGFTLLAMGFTGSEAMKWKLKYIEAFNSLEKAWNTPEQVMARALKLADKTIDSLKSKVYELETSVQQMDAVITEMTPKADYADRILSSTDCMTVSQIAQDYGMSAKRFNKILHSAGIQRKVGDQWILYAEYQGKGYVRNKTCEYTKGNGDTGTKLLTVWTQKGRMLIYEELKRIGVFPQMETAS